MSIQQALGILDQMIALAPVSRAAHQRGVEALQTLATEIQTLAAKAAQAKPETT